MYICYIIALYYHILKLHWFFFFQFNNEWPSRVAPLVRFPTLAEMTARERHAFDMYMNDLSKWNPCSSQIPHDLFVPNRPSTHDCLPSLFKYVGCRTFYQGVPSTLPENLLLLIFFSCRTTCPPCSQRRFQYAKCITNAAHLHRTQR